MSDVIKIAAVMSLPRVGFNDTWGCVLEALAPFKIPVRRFMGVFWGQCMQRALTQCMDDGCDWILCIDYDSMFTFDHVNKLISHFGENEHIDALAPMQVKRCGTDPLIGKHGKGSVTFDVSKPFRVDTAHFGLTLIRCDALRRLKKPWFMAHPGADGEWGDGRVDEDIYFWNQWYESGNTVYVAPDVRIGHLELMVSEFSDSYEVVHVHAQHWKEREHEKVRRAQGHGIQRDDLSSGVNRCYGPVDGEAIPVEGSVARNGKH